MHDRRRRCLMKNLAIRNVLTAAALAPLLAAALAFAAEDPPAEIADVLNKLHLSNQEEMVMGQQAKELGQSQAVKDYGATLERDHTAADEKVMSLARKKNIELPTIPPEQVKHEMPAGAA